MSDLTRETIALALGDRPHEFYDSIASSSDRALALLEKGVPSGTVVIADQQTSGRGRLGRAWLSPPGAALMLSVVLHPPANAMSDVGMMAALAVVETIAAMGATGAGIKWPNDVQIGGRKVCGVLPESTWQGERRIGAIVGIGINVRVDFAGSPLADSAISLEDVVGAVDRTAFLVNLLARIDHWSALLGSDAIFTAWRGRLNMIGRAVTVHTPTGVIIGTADRVERDGTLWVADAEGALQRMIAGDIAIGTQD